MALLSENTNLKNLSFVVTVDAHVLVDLAAALHQNTTLMALNINCRVSSPSSTDDRLPSDDIASAFAEMLKANRSLKRLTLRLNQSPITVQGATVLAEAVNVNTTLEKLVLRTDCTQEVIEQLKHGYPNIRNRIEFGRVACITST